MEYQFTDTFWRGKTVRMIRISNGKISSNGGFYEEGEAPEDTPSITVHDITYLKRLREQNEAEGRLVYFDIDLGYLENSYGLKEFQQHFDVYEDDGHEWITSTAKL